MDDWTLPVNVEKTVPPHTGAEGLNWNQIKLILTRILISDTLIDGF